MATVELRFLDRDTVEGLLPSMAEIVKTVEGALLAHGTGDVVLPPKSHLYLDDRFNGHFNILPGFVGPERQAGVKVISDYVDNYKQGLPSELGLLLLMDPANGAPKAIIDGSHLTDMRTGAVTAIGAKHLARAGKRRSLDMWARAARPIGTYACSTVCSTSTRSGCIPAEPRAGKPFPPGSRAISASR